MKLVEVNSKHLQRQFLEMPLMIYKNDPDYVRPLDQDVEKIFDPKKNKQFRQGKAIRWLLKDEHENFIGRIAAFYNERSAKKSDYLAGGIGFFECIHNQEAANLLFDAGRNWLLANGMECMDGPINFGERDAWWGLQIEGFAPPTYLMNYNPQYYQQLFEAYGFQTYFNQLVFNYVVDKPVPQKFWDKAGRFVRNPEYRFEHIKKNQLEKFAADLTQIYNEAWSKMGHFKAVTKEQTLSQLKEMKPIMDERLVWFGYHQDRPIVFFIMLPEINQIIRHLNGRFDWWAKLKFFFYLKRGIIHNMFGVLFGVVPEFQGKGLDGAVIIAAAKIIQPMKKYRNLEMNWVGDFNPKMVKMVEDLETTVIKRYRTYRKIFDENKPFRRAPVLD